MSSKPKHIKPTRNCVTPPWKSRQEFPKSGRWRDRFIIRAKQIPGSPRRLDAFLVSRFEGYSRAFIQDMIGAGRITVNGRRARKSQRVMTGDEIVVMLPEGAPDIAEDIPFDVIYEDAHMIVIDKPPGRVVHPARGNMTGTLTNAMFHYFRDEMAQDPNFKFYNLHRLDRGTSGVMIYGKDADTTSHIARQFETRAIRKRYLMLVHGEPDWDAASCDRALGNDPNDRFRIIVDAVDAKHAFTEFTCMARGGGAALIQGAPKTGRSHQIRVHIAHLGHPIIGDELYGGKADAPGLNYTAPRVLLHAWTLTLHHPVRDEIVTFTCPIPDDMRIPAERMGVDVDHLASR